MLMSGAKAMIGTALAAIGERQQNVASVAQRDVANADESPAMVPMTRPPRASMNVALAATVDERVDRPFQLSTSALAMADGGGSRNASQVEGRDQELPEHERRRRTRGSPAGSARAGATASPARARPPLGLGPRRPQAGSPDGALGHRRVAPTRGPSAHGSSCRGSRPRAGLADLGHELEVARALARVARCAAAAGRRR